MKNQELSMKHSAFLCLLLSVLLFVVGCDTVPQSVQTARLAMMQEIAAEQPGDYYIGRRFYKEDYKFWGYVRSPGQPWSTAKLVMLNEQKKLAPDRAANQIGSDNNSEYKLYGKFSGDTVYEPSSNGFYPEFVLTEAILLKTNPAPIFRTPSATDPTRRIIEKPY
jgi:hypothetical protein